MAQTSALTSSQSFIFSKIKDFGQLVKLRLTLMVVFSTGVGYVIAAHSGFQWFTFSILLLGGFLITGAANGINQIIEKDLDKLMTRTLNRPIAQGRLNVLEAGILVSIMSLLGVFLIGTFINSTAAIISALSLLIYAFVYTPLKQKTALSVWVGAIAGAAPPLIGYTAFAGTLDAVAWILFGFQFVWQLPHFWALAWVLNEEYNKAGFFLLPTKEGRTRKSALITLLSALILLPLIYISYQWRVTNIFWSLLLLLATIHFVNQAYNLYKTCELKEARKLMFGSFYYLPLIQLILILAQFIN
jgi:protoheme IX farnesyltransferase